MLTGANPTRWFSGGPAVIRAWIARMCSCTSGTDGLLLSTVVTRRRCNVARDKKPTTQGLENCSFCTVGFSAQSASCCSVLPASLMIS